MNKGENIKKLRKERGLTQKKLGDLCNIAESTIRRYEIGDLNPKLETIMKIAAALEVPYFHLLDEADRDAILNGKKNPYTDEVTQQRQIYDITNKLTKLGFTVDAGLNVKNNTVGIFLDNDLYLVATDEELIALEKDSNDYLKFKLIELRNSKIHDK